MQNSNNKRNFAKELYVLVDAGRLSKDQYICYIIGQCFQINLNTTELIRGSAEHVALLKYSVGGVLHKPAVIKSPEQITNLNRDIQSACYKPCLIGANCEGGYLYDLPAKKGYKPEVGTLTAKQMAQKVEGMSNYEKIHNASLAISAEMNKHGFNYNLAPLVDYNNWLEQNFENSSNINNNSQEIYELCKIFAFGQLNNNIIPCYKYFPCQGNDADSTKKIVDATAYVTVKELESFNLLFEDGCMQMLMMSHVYFKNWDNNMPASFSNTIISDVRSRDSNLIIVSDNIFKKSATSAFAINNDYTDIKEMIRRFFNAGGTMLLAGDDELAYDMGMKPTDVLDLTYKLVKNGEISLELLEHNYNLVMVLKHNNGIL